MKGAARCVHRSKTNCILDNRRALVHISSPHPIWGYALEKKWAEANSDSLSEILSFEKFHHRKIFTFLYKLTFSNVFHHAVLIIPFLEKSSNIGSNNIQGRDGCDFLLWDKQPTTIALTITSQSWRKIRAVPHFRFEPVQMNKSFWSLLSEMCYF